MIKHVAAAISLFFAVFVISRVSPADDRSLIGRFIKITGEVDFDDQKIVYDEVIEFRVQAATLTDMGQTRGNNQLVISRRNIFRRLDKGQGLALRVPVAVGLWADLDPRTKPLPVWKVPGYIEGALRPPPEFLPEFYWIDNLANPSFIQAYVSESYYSQPMARLKIVRPIRLEYVPPTGHAHDEAMQQAAAEPVTDIEKGRIPAAPDWWRAIVLLPVGEEVWRKIPNIANTVDEMPQNRPVLAMSRQQTEEIWQAAFPVLGDHWRDARSANAGVPQPLKYPGPKFRDGVLSGGIIDAYADDVISTTCRVDQRRCRAITGQRGFYNFYDRLVAPGWPLIEMGTYTIDPSKCGSFFDRQSGKIYIIDQRLL